MSSTWGHHAPSTAISALDHDILLDIFHWYRLGNTTNGFDRGWKLERWWFKLIHVCQSWRHLILASPTSLDLHLVCTYGTPVTTMLTHSPPLPLIIYYPGGLGDLAGADEEDVLFLLKQRERVRRIHIEALAKSLLDSVDGEYPALQHLVIRSHTKKLGTSSGTGVELRAKLQAPLLRHLALSNVRLPVGSELLLRAEGLVILELRDVTDTLEAHPAYLVAQLARMTQLERLIVHFRTALPNRKVERMLSTARTTRAALPRLKSLSFHGGSAYLEGVLARISAPSLQTLSLNFFAQLTFDLPCLVRFVRAAQELSLSPTAYAEGDGVRFQFEAARLEFNAEAAFLLLYSHATDPDQAGTITNPVLLCASCRTLDWQLAVFAQICGALAPLFERVERLTLGLQNSYLSLDAISSPDVYADLERARWHGLLRAFGGVKTLELAGLGAQYLRRSLPPFHSELLPALQRLLGGNDELVGGADALPGDDEKPLGGDVALLGCIEELLGGNEGPFESNQVSSFYNSSISRGHFENIGRAYREQATTLVEIRRLYVARYPQTYTENVGLQNILRLSDAALTAAGKAKKGTTTEATEAFAQLQEEIKRFGPPSFRKSAPGGHRKMLLDPSTALESASKKDEKSMHTLSRVKSAFKAPIPSGNTKKVNFVILESLHEERKDQLIINQEIDNSTSTAEIVWRFSRYPEKSAESADRITPKIASRQNPHFYLQLSKDAASFDSKFHKDPLKDFSHGLRQGDKIYVLLDKPCRLFLDAAKPHIPRIFGNLWKPQETVILKDAGGVLQSEDIALSNIGKKQDYWYRPIQSEYLGDDSEIINRPVGNGRDLVELALRSQKVDFMIRDLSRPLPPADSGWKRLPSPVLSVKVQGPEDQMTPRQLATRLLQLEYSNPNASASSTGDDMVPTTSTPPSLAPPASLTIPSPPPGQDRELLSAPPVRKWEASNSWFQKYKYDYDIESWRPREQ